MITKIAALKLPENPRTTLNVGRMGGGTTINAIAAEAWLELDLRSEGQLALADLDRKVENLVETAGQRGVRVDMELIGQRPAGEISFDHPIIRLAESCLRKQGYDPVLTVGSTDANIPLSKGYPAVVLGLTHGGGAHTLSEFVETGPVERGLEHLVDFVEQVWG
ncbi:MAG: M20/M25/M40 family metallo-hydrolase [Chloroflexi bacterium]|nr:M20/M25/M40 family metallo-hydrolase [Chloroflexota bacterium]